MKRSYTGLIVGILLVAVGGVMLAERLSLVRFDWSYMWPVLLIAAGLAFHIAGWLGGRRQCGLFMPGAILLVYGALFLFNVISSWRVMADFWPVFLLGPALGLFEMYLFGEARETLIPAGILTVVGGLFLATNLIANGYRFIMPGLVIAAGLVVVIATTAGPRRRRQESEDDYDVPPPGWGAPHKPPTAPPWEKVETPQAASAPPKAEEPPSGEPKTTQAPSEGPTQPAP